MGAEGVVDGSLDSEVMLDWYRASRALGFGEKPYMYSDDSIHKLYESILTGLNSFERESLYERRRISVHILRLFNILEFEVSCRLLLNQFPDTALKGMTKKSFHDLFLRCAIVNPGKIFAQESRDVCIKRLDEVGIIRKEWYTIY